MDQSTVLVLVGIVGNLALIGLLIFAWRLLMGGDQNPNPQSGTISTRELDELLAGPNAGRASDGDQLAGLFRFDSWAASAGGRVASNGRSSAADG